MKNQEKQFSIDWKEVKNLLDNKTLTAIGSNYHQVNNQGEYRINEAGDKIYKRRHTASSAIFDLIAKK